MQPGHRTTALVSAGLVLVIALLAAPGPVETPAVLLAFCSGALWGHYVWRHARVRPDGYVSSDEVLSVIRAHKEG